MRIEGKNFWEHNLIYLSFSSEELGQCQKTYKTSTFPKKTEGSFRVKVNIKINSQNNSFFLKNARGDTPNTQSKDRVVIKSAKLQKDRKTER